MVAKDDGNNCRLFSLQILGREEGGGMRNGL